MDINTIFIGLLLLPILYGTYIYFTLPVPIKPTMLWGEQVGRSKHIQSKTGDASLFTQGTRRTATQNGGFQKGFMNAAIDYFFISRICPCTKIPIISCKCKCCDIIDGGEGADLITYDSYDGGNVGTEYSNCNLDGGAVIHGQNCGCCPNTDGGHGDDISDTIYSGGNADTLYNGSNIDGGNV